MRLSQDEISGLSRAYERNRHRRYLGAWNPMLMGLIYPFVMFIHDLREDLHGPSAGRHLAMFCFLGFLFGAAIASIAVWSFFARKQARRDAETVAFFEKHFPDDCPWKQEEAVLRCAEELQREARISTILSHAELPR